MFINSYIISVGLDEIYCKKCGHMSQVDIYMVGISVEKCDFCTSMEEDVLDIENKCEYCGKNCGDRCFCHNGCYDRWIEQEGVSKCQNPECDNLTSWHFCCNQCLEASL